jgi:hypothetical protein
LTKVKDGIDAVKQEIAACEQEFADIVDDDFETNSEVSNQKKNTLSQTIATLNTKLAGILEQVGDDATQYANGQRLERLATCFYLKLRLWET